MENDWLTKVKANLNWKDKTLILWKNKKQISIPVQLTKSLITETSEESDSEEYESDDSDEASVYLTNYSDKWNIENLEFNPWINHTPKSSENEEDENSENEYEKENSVVFIAELAIKPENPPLNLGPLDHHQQKIFDSLLHKFKDICAKS